jgi:hypothetical protein
LFGLDEEAGAIRDPWICGFHRGLPFSFFSFCQ